MVLNFDSNIKLNLSLCLLRHHTMKICVGEWRCILLTFITLELDGAEWSALCLVLFRRLDGPQDWSGSFREDGNLLSFQEFNHNSLHVQPIA
jgi:hypothetical protein